MEISGDALFDRFGCLCCQQLHELVGDLATVAVTGHTPGFAIQQHSQRLGQLRVQQARSFTVGFIMLVAFDFLIQQA